MTEHAIQNAIRNALAGQCLLFRANVGQAWTGEAHRLPNGDVLLKNARPFNTGLPPGFSDLFGMTPDGIFLAGEVKTKTGKPTDKQLAFLHAVIRNGGRAGVWRSPEDALATVRGEKGKL